MAKLKLPMRSVAAELCRILDSPEITVLIAELEATRWTGRPGYPIRALVGLALAKSLYQRPTWTQVVALANEHDGLRRALGGEVPSIHACYRFTKKLLKYKPVLTDCADRLLASLKKIRPEMGENIAIDGSALHAYANGHKKVSKHGRDRRPEEFSDPDASWGHQSATSTEGKGRSIYGYKIHMAVDTTTEVPISWHVSTATAYEPRFAPGLLDEARRRGFPASTCAMDKGYDIRDIYDGFENANADQSSLSRRRGASRMVVIFRMSADMALGSTRGPTTKGEQPSGDARPESARRAIDGYRQVGFIR